MYIYEFSFLAPLSEDSSGAYQILIEPSSDGPSVCPSVNFLNRISSYSCYWILLKLGAVVPWDSSLKQMKRFFSDLLLYWPPGGTIAKYKWHFWRIFTNFGVWVDLVRLHPLLYSFQI